jgi:hypothetical protein
MAVVTEGKHGELFVFSHLAGIVIDLLVAYMTWVLRISELSCQYGVRQYLFDYQPREIS